MTYSVMAYDEATGELGGAFATAAIGSPRMSPWAHGMFPEYSDAAALVFPHAASNPGLAHRTFALLDEGRSLGDVEAELVAFDADIEWRQLTVMRPGGEGLVRTGSSANHYAGDASGPGWIVAGNALAGPEVVDAMVDVISRDTEQPLAERLLATVEAGRAAGGQAHPETREQLPELSGALYVVDGRSAFPVVDLRVDFDPDALTQLRKLYEHSKPHAWFFPLGVERPQDVMTEAGRRNAFDPTPLPSGSGVPSPADRAGEETA